MKHLKNISEHLLNFIGKPANNVSLFDSLQKHWNKDGEWWKNNIIIPVIKEYYSNFTLDDKFNDIKK